MSTWHIHIEGQVQGVGFRPFVYRQANRCHLCGWVNNGPDGVHIRFNAAEAPARRFLATLLETAPPLARITRHSIRPVKAEHFGDFQILHSQQEGNPRLLIPPDFGLCADCREELRGGSGRRKDYPFTTCTNCGPRYSILEMLPYDRERTAMQAFQMCPDCRQEYADPTNRRYHSQTNSCPQCAVHVGWYDFAAGSEVTPAQGFVPAVTKAWQDGKIVAIKGIGGYLLTCDATNASAVRLLRQRKHRPTKPFALMYPGLDMLQQDVFLNPAETAELTSVTAPILLLPVEQAPASGICLEYVAPGLRQIGALLPYTPLYNLLLQSFGKPIVATSGNISNAPIIYENEKAITDLAGVADFVLTNDRKIVVPQDDSVLTISRRTGQKIILRRARGLAPTFLEAELSLAENTILATGAAMKSTFAIWHQRNTYISQYLGDLESYETHERYGQVLRHFMELLHVRPELLLSDLHPDYFSTQFGEALSATTGVPLVKIQHHEAHFGAVLVENNLLRCQEPVLGIIWDGTGLGEDGQVWGGEFFLYENKRFQRCAHFDYFDFIAGDKMPREPRISALSITHEMPEAWSVLRPKFTSVEWDVYQKILRKADIKTSSVGRLFDAAASLLGVMDKASYEGEAALHLENLAWQYMEAHREEVVEGYFSGIDFQGLVPTGRLMQGILTDLAKGVSKEFIAAKFHFSLVQAVETVATQWSVKQLAFSGGVFQNKLLVELLVWHLGSKFNLHFHQALSPNDENISFGQLACYQIRQS